MHVEHTGNGRVAPVAPTRGSRSLGLERYTPSPPKMLVLVCVPLVPSSLGIRVSVIARLVALVALLKLLEGWKVPPLWGTR